MEAHETLTPREREVFDHLVQGYRNREIADILVISEGVVEGHVHNIFAKLKVRNRVEATAYAWSHGLVGIKADVSLVSCADPSKEIS